MKIGDCRIIELPKILDERGNLTFVEEKRHVPFAIRRCQWIYDVPGGQFRGSHAFHTLQEFIVALSGSFEVVLDDGKEEKTFFLNRSYYGLFIPPMIWRSLRSFSTNSLCLILVSDIYSAEEYIRDYAEFKELNHG